MARLIAFDTRLTTFTRAVGVRALYRAHLFAWRTVGVALILAVMSTDNCLSAFLITVTVEQISEAIAAVIWALMATLKDSFALNRTAIVLKMLLW